VTAFHFKPVIPAKAGIPLSAVGRGRKQKRGPRLRGGDGV
jgi:hypothetical protein